MREGKRAGGSEGGREREKEERRMRGVGGREKRKYKNSEEGCYKVKRYSE